MRSLLVAWALMLLSALPASAWAEEAAANGRNVTSVSAGPSRFNAAPYRRWSERNGDGVFAFEELYRDDRSVHLFDRSRNVRLQIDLSRGQVFYAHPEDSPEPRPLYAITSVRAETDVQNVVRVSVPMGVFRMTGPNTWVEQGYDGAVFNFVEQSRDDGFVHLLDPSRNVRLQIDLRRKHIWYADDSAPRMRRLYDITSFDAVS